MKIGERIAPFQALDHEGKAVSIDPDELKNPIVIYFYPKDDTPGCTKEACTFRDAYESFTEANVEVYGISADSVEDHRHFRSKHRLPFTLLSDPDNAIRKQFKVKGNLLGLIPGRVTFVIDEDGKVAHTFNSQLNAAQHVHEALKVIEQL